LDDWIARAKARGHAMLEEKQLKFHSERYGNIAHLWSSYALHSEGKQVARGINSIQAIKEAGGWRVVGIMLQAEAATAPLPGNICRKGGKPKSGEPRTRLPALGAHDEPTPVRVEDLKEATWTQNFRSALPA
jgi:hypothetical protein